MTKEKEINNNKLKELNDKILSKTNSNEIENQKNKDIISILENEKKQKHEIIESNQKKINNLKEELNALNEAKEKAQNVSNKINLQYKT